ncbi:hypothetical protein GCM10010129_13960 [Streptomyces fumigatiscleroticus]|nr:hypothetical protein GCM10010129_13960 [Streptomyces fumigatiscleroticus]
MVARSGNRPPFTWTKKDFPDNVLPDKRRLAGALQEICRHLVIKSADGTVLTHPTQAQAASHLNISETSLSRYLKGQYVPAAQVTASIFDRACGDAGGGQNLSITRKELLELRMRAAEERCGNCSLHREAARAAEQKLQAVQDAQEEFQRMAEATAGELRELRRQAIALEERQATALKEETGAQQARTVQPEAGPQKVREAARVATLLPVPRRQGDRQQSENETAAAQAAASRAEVLLRGGRPDSMLALLRHTAEAYAPVEVALLVTLLRMHGQHELADNLVHIYGRDRSDQDAVRAALVLHEQEAVADAEALLRAAAAHPGTRSPQARQ